MAASTPSLTRFRVEYRRDMTNRKYRVTVYARTPDEAREKAAIRDPQYLHSVQVRNLGDVDEPEPCEHPVVKDEEREGSAIYAICAMCDATLVDSGLEDEAGVPGWEQVDGLTAAKARDDLLDGVAHFSWLDRFDIEVEVI